MQHLILHKVRGEPAFDIAEQIQIGDEEGWIIPTSGHRAYPYWTIPLGEIVQNDIYYNQCVPDDWPDHYPAIEELHHGPKAKLNIPDFLRPMVKLKRRI